MSRDDELVEVGRVVKPHGLRGEVAVHVLTDRPEVRFAAGETVVLDGDQRSIESARPHQGRWLVRLDGVTDRDAAEGLRRASLWAPPLPGDDETDTFWVSELIGMTVRSEDGEDLGTVTSIVELPAAAGYDLLEVDRPQHGTWWLPAADELVEAIETDDGEVELVVVDPPAGLWDGDEQVALQPGDEIERPLRPGGAADTDADGGADASGDEADAGSEGSERGG